MLGNLMTILMTGLLAFGVLVLAPIASAAWAGQSFLSRLRPRSEFGLRLRGSGGVLLAAAAVFVLVAGIGAATSYLKEASEGRAPQANGDTLGALKDYTSTIRSEQPAHAAESGKQQLPDVNTMIDRLAARLESAPNDLKGWRTLGWSYYYTGRYKEAEAAYAKAVALDPKSEELKTEYDEVKAKIAEADSPPPSAPAHPETAVKEGPNPSAEEVARYQAMPADDRAAAIRSMVDGLASRLESSPRDVEGWARLMRSRVVLGEKDVAETAARKALDVFKDDPGASGRIRAAAVELGLKVE